MEDVHTKITTKINPNGATTYNFSIDGVAESATANRFWVVFKQATGSPLSGQLSCVHEYPKYDHIGAGWNAETETYTDKYEVDKSYDGIYFNNVNTVSIAGNGNSNTIHVWLDEKKLLAATIITA